MLRLVSLLAAAAGGNWEARCLLLCQTPQQQAALGPAPAGSVSGCITVLMLAVQNGCVQGNPTGGRSLEMCQHSHSN